MHWEDAAAELEFWIGEVLCGGSPVRPLRMWSDEELLRAARLLERDGHKLIYLYRRIARSETRRRAREAERVERAVAAGKAKVYQA